MAHHQISIAAMSTQSRKNLTLIPLATIAALAVVASLWLVMKPGKVVPVEADVVELAQFVSSDQYKSLSLQDRLPYMKRLRKDASAVREAFAAARITKPQFDAAYLNGWMARQFDRMDEYYSIPEAVRTQTLHAEYLKPVAATKSADEKTEGPDDAEKDHFIGKVEKLMSPEELAKWEQYRKDVKAAKSAAKARSK